LAEPKEGLIMWVLHLFFGLGLGIFISLLRPISEQITKRFLKSKGMEFCRCCDDALASSSMGLCSPCQYFYDEEETARLEYERLEMAQ